jgi:hypothetical protein
LVDILNKVQTSIPSDEEISNAVKDAVSGLATANSISTLAATVDTIYNYVSEDIDDVPGNRLFNIQMQLKSIEEAIDDIDTTGTPADLSSLSSALSEISGKIDALPSSEEITSIINDALDSITGTDLSGIEEAIEQIPAKQLLKNSTRLSSLSMKSKATLMLLPKLPMHRIRLIQNSTTGLMLTLKRCSAKAAALRLRQTMAQHVQALPSPQAQQAVSLLKH